MAKISRILLVTFLVINACSPVGPSRIRTDAPSYANAIRESNKAILFDNIIRLRYADPLSFVELTQVVAGYTLRNSANVGGELEGVFGPDVLGLLEGGTGFVFEDRPTMTFSPVRGRTFFKEYIVPVDLTRIFSAIMAGWPPSLVLGLLVERINDVSNVVIVGRYRRGGDPEFGLVVDLFSQLIAHNVIEIRLRKQKPDSDVVYNVSLAWRGNQDVVERKDREAAAELRTLLGLDTKTNEFEIVFGRRATRQNEIAIKPRSIFQLLAHISAMIDVPEADIKSGRTFPTIAAPAGLQAPISVRYSSSAPTDVYVAARRGATAFWIDDENFNSKRTMVFILTLLSLVAREGPQEGPVIAIPG